MRPTTATSRDTSPILFRLAGLIAASLLAVWCGIAPGAEAATPTKTRPSWDREVVLTRPGWFWSSIPPGRSAALEEYAQILWLNPPGVREHDLYPALRAEEGGNDRGGVEARRMVLMK